MPVAQLLIHQPVPSIASLSNCMGDDNNPAADAITSTVVSLIAPTVIKIIMTTSLETEDADAMFMVVFG